MSGFDTLSTFPYQHSQRTSGFYRPSGSVTAQNGPHSASSQELTIAPIRTLDPPTGATEGIYQGIHPNSGSMGVQVDYMRRCTELEQELRVCHAQNSVMRYVFNSSFVCIMDLSESIQRRISCPCSSCSTTPSPCADQPAWLAHSCDRPSYASFQHTQPYSAS